jgi:hypothetical protein
MYILSKAFELASSIMQMVKRFPNLTFHTLYILTYLFLLPVFDLDLFVPIVWLKFPLIPTGWLYISYCENISIDERAKFTSNRLHEETNMALPTLRIPNVKFRIR